MDIYYAQTQPIFPDKTLPQNSRINRNGNIYNINNSTVKESNLFHSFERFNVPNGTETVFNNTSNIKNIFTKVTGNSISNIDGILKANGSANLFLINPNRILFGD